ncbi:Uncharacterised protein [uncultured archaeon]|nr:Uncharacterised protein [uncultured archaeon]
MNSSLLFCSGGKLQNGTCACPDETYLLLNNSCVKSYCLDSGVGRTNALVPPAACSRLPDRQTYTPPYCNPSTMELVPRCDLCGCQNNVPCEADGKCQVRNDRPAAAVLEGMQGTFGQSIGVKVLQVSSDGVRTYLTMTTLRGTRQTENDFVPSNGSLAAKFFNDQYLNITVADSNYEPVLGKRWALLAQQPYTTDCFSVFLGDTLHVLDANGEAVWTLQKLPGDGTAQVLASGAGGKMAEEITLTGNQAKNYTSPRANLTVCAVQDDRIRVSVRAADGFDYSVDPAFSTENPYVTTFNVTEQNNRTLPFGRAPPGWIRPYS